MAMLNNQDFNPGYLGLAMESGGMGRCLTMLQLVYWIQWMTSILSNGSNGQILFVSKHKGCPNYWCPLARTTCIGTLKGPNERVPG